MPARVEPTRTREHLANERTLLAWTRTVITLITLGFVVARFGIFLREVQTPSSASHGSALIGIGLVLAGLVAGAASVVRFFRARRQIEEGHFRAEVWPELLLVAVTSILGVAVLIYLAANA